MTLIIFNKKASDCDKRYHAIEEVDYFIHNNNVIEIHYLNGTRESRSTNDIKIVDVSV